MQFALPAMAHASTDETSGAEVAASAVSDATSGTSPSEGGGGTSFRVKLMTTSGSLADTAFFQSEAPTWPSIKVIVFLIDGSFVAADATAALASRQNSAAAAAAARIPRILDAFAAAKNVARILSASAVTAGSAFATAIRETGNHSSASDIRR